MEAKPKAGEDDLSMEEILHSIRKIIAEDGEEAGAGGTPANGTDPVVAGSDVLELTELVEEPAPARAPAPASTDVLSQIDQAVVDEPQIKAPAPVAPVAAAPTPAPAPKPAPAVSDANQAYIDSLLSKESANAASAALKRALPIDGPIPTTPSTPLRSGNTVEDLVMESLKPMLKSWLDANLPTIVERIVEREVRKLSQ